MPEKGTHSQNMHLPVVLTKPHNANTSCKSSNNDNNQKTDTNQIIFVWFGPHDRLLRPVRVNNGLNSKTGTTRCRQFYAMDVLHPYRLPGASYQRGYSRHILLTMIAFGKGKNKTNITLKKQDSAQPNSRRGDVKWCTSF